MDIQDREELINLALGARVDPEEDINQEPQLLSVWHEDMAFDFMTLGNFSAIMGKQKSKKTFFVTMCAAAVVYQKLYDKRLSPMAVGNVAIVDTEQGRYHVQKVAKRIKRLTGVDKGYNVFALRRYSPEERLMLIDTIIKESPQLVLLIIDGIRDLVYDINSAEEATNIATQLMKWTYDYNLHICCVIHQNKSDMNARGHIGTEVQNKAETVVEVSRMKGSNISKAEFLYCRGMAPNDIYFDIENGLPLIRDYDFTDQ